MQHTPVMRHGLASWQVEAIDIHAWHDWTWTSDIREAAKLTGTSVDIFGSSTEESASLDERAEVSCIQDTRYDHCLRQRICVDRSKER